MLDIMRSRAVRNVLIGMGRAFDPNPILIADNMHVTMRPRRSYGSFFDDLRCLQQDRQKAEARLSALANAPKKS